MPRIPIGTQTSSDRVKARRLKVYQDISSSFHASSRNRAQRKLLYPRRRSHPGKILLNRAITYWIGTGNDKAKLDWRRLRSHATIDANNESHAASSDRPHVEPTLRLGTIGSKATLIRRIRDQSLSSLSSLTSSYWRI